MYEFVGRVFAFDVAIFTLTVSISPWLTGFITDAFQLSPRLIVLLLAIGSLVPLAVWSLALRWQSRHAETSQYGGFLSQSLLPINLIAAKVPDKQHAVSIFKLCTLQGDLRNPNMD